MPLWLRCYNKGERRSTAPCSPSWQASCCPFPNPNISTSSVRRPLGSPMLQTPSQSRSGKHLRSVADFIASDAYTPLLTSPLELRDCPLCRVSWVGGEVSAPIKQFCEPGAFHSRLLGLRDPKSGSLSYWQCPDCDQIFQEVKDG